MNTVYIDERIAILEDKDNCIIHILDNYRLVKEVVTKKDNLLSTIKKEFKEDSKLKKLILKELKEKDSDIDKVKKILSKTTKTLRTCMW